jgi:hypothetical protein
VADGRRGEFDPIFTRKILEMQQLVLPVWQVSDLSLGRARTFWHPSPSPPRRPRNRIVVLPERPTACEDIFP